MSDIKESLYDVTATHGEILKNRGFDYKNVIVSRTVSNHLFKNETVRDFLNFINKAMFTYIEAVKKIRVFDNYAVPKNYTKIP